MTERSDVIADTPVVIKPWVDRIADVYKARGLTGYYSQAEERKAAPYWVAELNRWLTLDELAWQPKKRQQA